MHFSRYSINLFFLIFYCWSCILVLCKMKGALHTFNIRRSVQNNKDWSAQLCLQCFSVSKPNEWDNLCLELLYCSGQRGVCVGLNIRQQTYKTFFSEWKFKKLGMSYIWCVHSLDRALFLNGEHTSVTTVIYSVALWVIWNLCARRVSFLESVSTVFLPNK